MDSLAVGGVRRTQPWPTKTLQQVPTILVEEIQELSRAETVVSTIDHRDNSCEQDKKDTRTKTVSLKKFLVPDIFMRRGSEKSIPELTVNGHQLVNHNFKKATFCDVCHRLLVAGLQRHGLRCKICKANLHANCATQVEECQGVPLGSFSFNRQLSPSGQSPENGCFSTENKVDSVYQVLKEGIILRTCKESGSSGCSSLHRNSSMDSNPSPSASDTNIKSGTDSNSPLMRKKGSNQQLAESSGASPSHNQETARGTPEQRGESPLKELTYQKKNSRSPSPGEGPTDELQPETRGQLKIQQMERYVEEGNLFVALYKFEAKQRDDLSLRPGDRVVVTNDKDEAWWIGECENKSGFFPANFVMSVRPTEEICHCIQATTLKDTNNKEIQLKRNQVLAIRLDWPVSNANYVYARSPSAEGYVRKEDLQPL